jgi:hypothetical protein
MKSFARETPTESGLSRLRWISCHTEILLNPSDTCERVRPSIDRCPHYQREARDVGGEAGQNRDDDDRRPDDIRLDRSK